jgi:hypothetical protein
MMRLMAVFRDLLQRIPTSRYAERGRVEGWLARLSALAITRKTRDVRTRGRGVSLRADYRPHVLYWSGRARDRMNDQPAPSRYQLVGCRLRELVLRPAGVEAAGRGETNLSPCRRSP